MKKYFTAKTHFYAKKIGKKFGNITVKDTTSRWGSCASNGNIAYSWRLGFAPIFVIDYIVAHEVSHLEELNHSYKFWRIVKRIICLLGRTKRILKRTQRAINFD